MKYFLALLLLTTLAHAQPAALPLSVTANGALTAATATGAVLRATLGQSVARYASATGQVLHTGFWAAAPRLQASPIGAAPRELPHEFAFHPAYPNPFNPSTTLAFALPQAADVRLELYDVTGRLVARLLDARIGAGEHRITWPAARQASGLYYARLFAGEYASTQRLHLIK